MKSILFSLFILSSFLLITACGASDKPVSEKDKAAQYGMTQEEYQEAKSAAARMNMTMDKHQEMLEE
ncbi:MAG: hypothetical protein Q8P95_01990 [bacterium]|nr:hypothetical protein [bacterium]